MSGSLPPVVDFYSRHPISEGQIVDALQRQGKDLKRLAPEDLYDLDQDHYGGLEAVEALARRAGIDASSRVLDVCAGLAGPARFLARRWGARVTGIDLNPDRVAGARRLSAAVGLSGLVRMIRGDAQKLPFRARAFTAVVSQEGLLHVPDKAAALAECWRVLLPGGRMAFSDWIATGRLGDGERRRLEEWMAAVTLQTIDGYRSLLARAGFVAIGVEDLSVEWVAVLRRRLEMFKALRGDTVARLGQTRYDEYEQLYAFFVGLVEAGKLGGGRFSATAGPGTS
ncbi:MAG TPA: methyltransferase domain-containing protein [Candidatus Bathyarchaeia archaeon]|nr:methyltransferase domain-containing protein [Candidatus Bathyarchaeia archaeon]